METTFSASARDRIQRAFRGAVRQRVAWLVSVSPTTTTSDAQGIVAKELGVSRGAVRSWCGKDTMPAFTTAQRGLPLLGRDPMTGEAVACE